MIGLTYLLMCFLYFVCVGLDVMLFFLQIRLIQQWKTVRWLVPLDTIGDSLVNAMTAKVSGFSKGQNRLSEKGKLIMALALLAIVRIVLGVILTLA